MPYPKSSFNQQVSKRIYESIYDFEQEIFSSTFSLTPNNFNDFKKFRPISKLSASVVLQNNEIISCIVNEKLTNEHAQSVIVGTKANQRKKGFLKSLSKINFDGLYLMGFYFISFWSSPDSPLFKIYSEQLECISKNQVLTSNEIKLREDYFRARKVEPFHTNLRTINDFYKLKSNTTSPASFWVFKLGK
jgi:hypothetical protein